MRKHHGLGLCKNVMDGMSRKLRLLTCHPYIPFNDIIPLSVEKKCYCVYRDPVTVTNEAFNTVKQTNEPEYLTILNIHPSTAPTSQSTVDDYEQV